MKRFALNGRPAIEQAPPQTYCSALIFAPDKSLVRRRFEDKIPKWMKRLPKLSLQRLERIITDARGPYLLGHVGGILTRRRAAGIGFRRQHGAAVGRGDGRRAPDDRACLLRQRLILHSRWIFHTDESRASAPRRPARPLSARRLCTSASHISRRELDPTELGKASLAPC